MYLYLPRYAAVGVIRKYFSYNLMFMVLANVLVKPFWIFFIDRVVQNRVGNAEYGVYSSLMSLAIIFNIILDLGITNLNSRELSFDKEKMGMFFPNMFVLKWILAFVYLVILLGIGFVSGYRQDLLYLLIAVGVIQILNSFLQFLRSNMSAHHDFRIDSFFSILDKLLVIGLGGFFLFISAYRERFDVLWFAYVQIAAYILALIAGTIVILVRYERVRWANVSFSQIILTMKRSMPYALLIFLMAIYMRADLFLLERIDSSYQAGVYVQAYRLLDMLNMFGFLFAGMLLPMFSRLLGNYNEVSSLVSHSIRILFPISISICIFCIFYGDDIMHLLYADYNIASYYILVLVISCFPAYCLMHIYSTLLTASARLKVLLGIAFLGALLSIILNTLLIPKAHALGAAFCAFAVQWTVGILYYVYCRKYFVLKSPLISYRKYLLFFIILIILNVLIARLGLHLTWLVIINVCGFIVFAYITKIWSKDMLLSYFKTI